MSYCANHGDETRTTISFMCQCEYEECEDCGRVVSHKVCMECEMWGTDYHAVRSQDA